MIKALAGMIRADEGETLIAGEAVRLRSPEDALRRGVSTVFQELTLLVLEDCYEISRLETLDDSTQAVLSYLLRGRSA